MSSFYLGVSALIMSHASSHGSSEEILADVASGSLSMEIWGETGEALAVRETEGENWSLRGLCKVT